MRLDRTNLFCGMACFLIMFCFSVQGYSEEKTGSVLAKKTLTRWVDPVLVAGSMANEVIGAPIPNIRLYAFTDGLLKPILFQVDEMTEDGDWIFPNGNIPNTELGNGKFDTWDKIIFMAEDTGDRVSRQAWVQGCTRGAEIEVIDRVTGGKGWVYVLYFASNPPAPSSEPPYVNYDYGNDMFSSDYFGMQFVITEDGRHITSYKNVYVTKGAGGDGENFVDTLKIRVILKVLFKAVTLTYTEQTLSSDTLAYKCGPVRVLKRFEQYVYIPGGFKAFRCVPTETLSRTAITVPIAVNVPLRMGTVLSSAVVRVGTDYNSSVIGSKLYNSNNTHGCLVDGKMSDCEENWSPGPDEWRLITGNFGTFMARTIMAPELYRHVGISMGVIDDLTIEDPPENYPGTIGFLYQDWELKDVPRGKYTLYLEWYYPAHYKPEVIADYTNMLDNTLRIRAGGLEDTNQLLLVPNLGEKYKSIRKKKK